MGHYKCMFNLFNICIVTTFLNDLFTVIEILFIYVPKFFEYKYSKSSSMISRHHFAKKKTSQYQVSIIGMDFLKVTELGVKNLLIVSSTSFTNVYLEIDFPFMLV